MSILKTVKNLLRKILPQPGFESGISRLAGTYIICIGLSWFIICCLYTLALQCIAPY